MKTLLSFFFTALALWALSMGPGCSEDPDRSSGGRVAVSPTAVCMTNGINQPDQRCLHQQGLFPGYSPYPVVGGSGLYIGAPHFQAGLCDCAPGSYPIYSAQYGLGCVQQQQIFPNQVPYTLHSWHPTQMVFGVAPNSVWQHQTHYQNPQSTPVVNFFSTQATCHNGVLQLCDTRADTPCPNEGYCRKFGGAGVLGACVESHETVGR